MSISTHLSFIWSFYDFGKKVKTFIVLPLSMVFNLSAYLSAVTPNYRSSFPPPIGYMMRTSLTIQGHYDLE